ncbi:MAG: hypothetical protein K2Q32_02885, partial [Alphaproteobacteria bacterium]|nr:hypothetical protein [Alphaproteobacteria bacterium]
MTKQYQPLTLQITTTPRHLRTQLLAAWPTALGFTSRLRAIKTITKYIKDTLPADYKSDISVFISNQASSIHEPATQGFLYHLAQQQIVTRQPVKKTNNTALLHVHFTTAQSADENEEKLKTETVAISRIDQIKQWQKETVKAMFQAMADTAISMETQTALRGTMAGLNKLGALLNKAVAAQKLPQGIAKVAAQKTARQDIANTLSDIRGNLSLAAGNGLKPPTKSQLALRQQLNKLDKIVPQQQKAAVKSAPILKTVVATKSTPSSKPIAQAKPTTSTRPSITNRFTVKTAPTRIARISIQPLRLNTVAKTFVAPRTAIPGTVIRGTAMPGTPIRSLTHRVATPARLVVGIAQRISSRAVAITAHRFTAAATKLVITKIAQHPTLTKNAAVQSRGIPQLTRTTPRYEINRQIIKRLVVTPAILVAQRVAASPTITDMPAKQVHSGVRTEHSNESKPIAHQIIRQPAHYAAITPQISLNPIAMLQTQQSTAIATPFFVQPRADAILNRVLNTDAPLRSSPLPVTNTNIAQTITSQSSASPIA